MIDYAAQTVNEVRYGYDKNGNVIAETYISNGVTTYILLHPETKIDALNRSTETDELVYLGDPTAGAPQVTYTTTTTYDDAHNRIITVDPRGNDPNDHVSGKTISQKDGLDRTRSVTADVGGLNLVTEYTYDADGNVATVKDPQGGDTDVHYTYDGLNREIRIDYIGTPSDTGPVSEVFFYDGNNNVVAHRDRRGTLFTTAYDNINRVTAQTVTEWISHAGQTLTLTSNIYDDLHNRVTQYDANHNQTIDQFDALGRLILLTDALGYTVQSSYDGMNKISEIDKNGNLTKYTYDDINRLRLTEEFGSTRGSTPISTMSVDFDDSRNQVVHTDRRQIKTVQQFDSLTRLLSTSREHPALAAEYQSSEVVLDRHEYDADGHEILSTDALGNQTKYVYDGAGRRTDVIEGFGSAVAGDTHYTYDNVGNVLTVKDARNSGAAFDLRYTYDARYRKVTSTDGAGDTTVYTYDADNDLTSMTAPRGVQAGHSPDPQFTTTYRYDEFGSLLSVDETALGGGITRYVYDADRNVIAQQDPNGNLVTYTYDKLNRVTDTYQHLAPGRIGAGTSRDGSFGGDTSTALHSHIGYDGKTAIRCWESIPKDSART